MPPKAKTQLQIDLDKDLMIDEAQKLIQKSGLDKFTMRKLSNQMGMSAANMYNYFYSKDEIYIYIRIRGFRMLQENLENALIGFTDPLERLRNFAQEFIAFGIEYMGYYQLIFSTQDPKSLYYADSPFEELAKKEKENGMITFYYIQKLVYDCSPALDAQTLYTITTRIICELNGFINLYHSTIIQEISPDFQATLENLIDHICSEFKKR